MSFSPFQFTSPLLINAQFTMFRQQKAEDDVSIHLCRKIIRPEEKESQAVVELRVQLNKTEDQIREDACFAAEVTMQSLFTWPEEMDAVQVEALLTKNAPAMLLSYARPIIAQLTGSSPLQAFHIPFVNMNELTSALLPNKPQ